MFDVFIFFHFSIHNQQTQVKSKVKFCRDGYIVTLASCNASFWQEALLHQYFVLARDCLMHHRRRTAVHNTEGASAPALGLCSGLCFSSQPPSAAMFSLGCIAARSPNMPAGFLKDVLWQAGLSAVPWAACPVPPPSPAAWCVGWSCSLGGCSMAVLLFHTSDWKESQLLVILLLLIIITVCHSNRGQHAVMAWPVWEGASLAHWGHKPAFASGNGEALLGRILFHSICTYSVI